MDKSYGMSNKAPHRADHYMKGFEIRDNTQAPEVRGIDTNSEQYDLGKVKKLKSGSRGYPAQAWAYDY